MHDELVLTSKTRATFCNQSKSLLPLPSLLVSVVAAGVDATKALASKSIERELRASGPTAIQESDSTEDYSMKLPLLFAIRS